MAVTIRYDDNFTNYMSSVESALTAAGNVIALDLTNAARSTAPHKYGQLERGINGEVRVSSSGIQITVGASAVGSNGYDYAQKMHNGGYMLGEQSRAKGSGYSGIAGNRYPVGPRYLLMPMVMGQQAYFNYFADAFSSVGGGYR